jgi:hypothetical protein
MRLTNIENNSFEDCGTAIHIEENKKTTSWFKKIIFVIKHLFMGN